MAPARRLARFARWVERTRMGRAWLAAVEIETLRRIRNFEISETLIECAGYVARNASATSYFEIRNPDLLRELRAEGLIR